MTGDDWKQPLVTSAGVAGCVRKNSWFIYVDFFFSFVKMFILDKTYPVKEKRF